MPSNERYQTAITLLALAGFKDRETWIRIDQIVELRSYIMKNRDELDQKLPKSVLGDLSRLCDDEKYRRTLLSFIRRLAIYCSSAIVRKRLRQKRKENKRCSIYGYKLAMPIPHLTKKSQT